MSGIADEAATVTDSRYPVWFHPANESRDFQELFTNPNAWPSARSKVTVFEFSPHQVATTNTANSINSYAALKAIGAFKQIVDWGMQTAIEVGVVKPWSCDGKAAVAQALQYVENIYAAGGTVEFLAMDHPLDSDGCGLTDQEAASVTAAWATSVRCGLATLDPSVKIVDIEGYPSSTVAQIEARQELLAAAGLRPDGFELDVDVYHVERLPRGNATRDLRELRAFFANKGIPFGVIFWPGHIVTSDNGYVMDTLDWVNRVHQAIGKPDFAVFESWVIPASAMPGIYYDTNWSGNPEGIFVGGQSRYCADTTNYCNGTPDAPASLPETSTTSALTHTMLLNQGVPILTSAANLVVFNRLINTTPGQGAHHFTADPVEMVTDMEYGWKHEGYAGYIFTSETPGAQPLYRLNDSASLDHLFTTSASEASNAEADGYVSEGIAGYVWPQYTSHSTALFRVYNRKTRAHFYTVDPNEYAALTGSGWVAQGIQCYMPLPSAVN